MAPADIEVIPTCVSYGEEPTRSTETGRKRSRLAGLERTATCRNSEVLFPISRQSRASYRYVSS